MKTKFELGVSMVNECSGQEKALECHHSSNYASCSFSIKCHRGEKVSIRKYVGIATSLDYKSSEVAKASQVAAERASKLGFDTMLEAQSNFWESIWESGDIKIEGDAEAQQGIRFNIFQLNQTYTGKDDRFNIGPKGFTGEKYGGSTYWDTEAYCLPFYLNTRDSKVARQLLVYRYRHLEKAIENAAKLGFHSGAALYPMVTMNGEECHNEWEITFEEIHRNGAIAYAIFNYVRHTDDKAYLAEYGFDVLLGISRFWAQRVNWSENKQAYVMLGVTGPNEYENNVNNNWYTNYIATWCLRYTIECFEFLKLNYSESLQEKTDKYKFDTTSEIQEWKNIIARMYFPEQEGSNIVLQQDGFLDKELNPVSSLDPSERPINQHWSWDRILRSVYIKQADVLQGMYFFEHEFSKEKIKANFDFYEPLTVHESSLSPCVHVILAAALNYEAKAYELYLRTSRLDLDDYNHEAHEGLHITSMAGTWLSVVEGFGGLRYTSKGLSLHPLLPSHWKSLGFKILYRGHLLDVSIRHGGVQITNNHSEGIDIELNGKWLRIAGNQ
jgi:maltose phosphorylase